MISIGTTFAFINLTLTGTKKQVISAGNLDLELQEDENNLTITNALPMYDEVGMIQAPFTFRLVNKTANDTNYIIKLVPVNTNELSPSDVKYGLEKDGVKTIDLVSNMQDDIIDSGTIKGNQTINYTLRLWIKDSVTENPTISNKILSYKVDVEVSQKIATIPASNKLIVKANSEDLTYANATPEERSEMWAFSHEATEQTAALVDYRYVGRYPNNYITFNNEMWRIIGVFPTDDGTGNIEQRIKIVRDKSIGSYARNNTNGSNNWNDNILKDVLNNGAYWNRTNEQCRLGSNNAMLTCDFTSSGLTDEAKSKIDDAVYYLGAHTDYQNLGAEDYYNFERGTNVYSGRDTKWVGKIGLIYASDSVYTYGKGVNNACYMNGYTCGNTSNPFLGWIFDSTWTQWTLTPFIDMDLGSAVFYLSPQGQVDLNGVGNMTNVRPVVYLKSDIELISGTGTSTDPYTIK